MTSAVNSNRSLRRADGSAANDDSVGRNAAFARSASESETSQSGGWDAYEVWHRLIKEARDRRAGRAFPQ